ncbi:MAG: bifunctional diaminohydroxyphosphoribosylaminopyrimidine deaminase/5-amino-6-(5-phosphoribosylamino)uracil reductase RibD [Bifidobacteriaceae bacterium]|nr:bifunctional diaminohydroxyphosphoribosylaminopyrimidine deaminase/5-amino-6-(5-phosphoribosylamino)uracil reductase RibD [Bifidobacteriaceae bacterium]MCI1914255.1 bifunctional diaminohydroxyphosphoribosylaminopyrimidine deaminase/5-amino-6-(5-phosphoribosylamino)uracil reductase RibD [Bifidobacteriaceae bacterium]
MGAKQQAMPVSALSVDDIAYLGEALELARGGYGYVNPNPLVGAVIVDKGHIVARGFHERYGQAHAERNALADAAARGVDVHGMTMYVTLEPCAHQGKTPPCAPAVAASGIKRVVVGTTDPNPKVNGKGLEILRAAGVRVDVAGGEVRRECDEINEAFFHFIETGTPFVTLKYAMSLDGKIAAGDGSPLVLSGTASRQRVHEDRARVAAVVTGIGTVLSDDPRLSARPARQSDARPAHQPVRVVVDSRLHTPLTSNLVRQSSEDGLTLIATSSEDSSKIAEYERAGCTVVTMPSQNGHVSIPALMEMLGRRKLDDVLLETGGTLAAAFLSADCVHKVEAFVTPKLVGARTAPSPVMADVQLPASFHIRDPRITRYDEDILIEGRI